MKVGMLKQPREAVRGLKTAFRKTECLVKQSLFEGLHFGRVDWRTSKHVRCWPNNLLVYNRVKKAGNSTVLMHIDDVIYPVNKKNSSYRERKSEALQRTSYLQWLPVKSILKFQSFYIFTFFRNPYARLLSAYLDKVGKGNNPKHVDVPGYDNSENGGFRDFLTFLETGGLYRDGHWWPQVDLLFFPIKKFDYIGKLENIGADLPLILEGAGIDFDESVNLGRVHASEATSAKINNSGDKMMNYYTQSLKSRVYSLYEKDFLVGGDDR